MIAFGPIPSRRLGKSLGINNITVKKACSYCCVYCQISLTHDLSVQRNTFYAPDVLFKETEKHLKKLDPSQKTDYLTFVSNGEPTLDVNLGSGIELLKKFNIPIAVITNASLIYDPQVQNDLLKADQVSLKIDTIAEDTWRKLNLPALELCLEKILSGIEEFTSLFKGDLRTETMLVNGYNDDSMCLTKTASFIASIQPKTAYLSIPKRPPAVKEIRPVSEEKLSGAWNCFHRHGIHTELLTGFEGTNTGTTGNVIDDILNITAVYPLREDAMKALLIKNKAEEYTVNSLMKQDLIKKPNTMATVFI